MRALQQKKWDVNASVQGTRAYAQAGCEAGRESAMKLAIA